MNDPLEAEARARGVSVETLRAFYAQRSASLRNSHTTARQGTTGSPAAQPTPAPRSPALAQPQSQRPGILGFVADRVLGALSGH